MPRTAYLRARLGRSTRLSGFGRSTRLSGFGSYRAATVRKRFSPQAARRAGCFLLALISLAACNRGAEKQVAVIPKSTSNVYWIAVHAGAVAAGEQYKLRIVWDGPPQETDYSRQVEIVDSMIARHVDGIAVAATERDVLGQSLDRAAGENIPVTVFDSGVNSKNYLSFVATDNFAAGQMAGRELGQLLNGTGTVAEVMHAPGSQSTMERERGFEDAMAHGFPKIQIVAKNFSMGDRAKAMAVSEDLLSAHPDLNGIFASSEPSSVGSSQALKARRLSGKVKLVAFDSSEGMIQDLEGGTISALIVQDPFTMGFKAVETLAQKFAGKTPEKKIDLPATVVTRDNMQQPQIHKLLYPEISKYLK
ncbi:substrate-binding domain-containing protein [Nevskia soli]|uniref:substrate-binding domain-containing protein n=1 Tax=Nevskia soli TaxID=418856 RepID=UPI0015D87C94|nr:substrate-binding domain-containing protein [Nevskia soli]